MLIVPPPIIRPGTGRGALKTCSDGTLTVSVGLAGNGVTIPEFNPAAGAIGTPMGTLGAMGIAIPGFGRATPAGSPIKAL